MHAPFFFVLGLPKSGTTWVQKALDAHPQLICRGEGKFMIFRKALGDAALHYSDYLTDHQRKVFGEEMFPPMSRAEFDRLYRYFMVQRLRGDAPIPPGVRRIGNKDPEHGVILGDLCEHFPDAAYIHIIRDPRDIAVSTWHHMRRIEPDWMTRFKSFEDFARENVKEWAGYLDNVRKGAAIKALDYLELRYEDMHAAETETVRRVFTHLKVDAAPEIVARCIEAARFERASGGRARGEADAASFYRKGAVGDWRNHMDDTFSAELLAGVAAAADLGYR